MSYESNIPQAKRRLQQAQRRALEAIGVYVTGETQLRAPVDTGNLRASYTHRVDAKGKAVDVGTNVEYAVFVEKGTRHQQPQPHLTPAAEENVPTIRRLAREQFAEGMRGDG